MSKEGKDIITLIAETWINNGGDYEYFQDVHLKIGQRILELEYIKTNPYERKGE